MTEYKETPSAAAELPADPPMDGRKVLRPRQCAKVRRVGMFTMGIALILSGIVALIYLFYPSLDLVSLLKYAPALLVLLGVEILVCGFVFRGDVIKYDFLSMFVCFALICACVAAAAVYPLLSYYGPQLQITEETLSSEACSVYQQALLNEDDVRSVWADVSLLPTTAQEDVSLSSLRPGDTVRISVELLSEYPSKEAFCEKAEEILRRFDSAQPQADQVRIVSGDSRYRLDVSSPFETNFTSVQLEKIVSEEE